MYTENITHDVTLFLKAFLTNQLARFAPALYVKLTHQTGRGKDDTHPSQVAKYYIECFYEYFDRLGIDRHDIPAFLKSKRVLEYGPGDILGVALLMYAHGADSIQCVDRFPLRKISAFNIEVYRLILDSLDEQKCHLACDAFVEYGKPETGFTPNAIKYVITKNGLAEQSSYYDLIISRAVLEHVNRLDRTLANIAQALTRNGVSIHQVDLKSHGLDRYREFDFLTWPDWLYSGFYIKQLLK